MQASASSIMLFYSYVCKAYLCKGLQVFNSVRFLRLYSIFVPASASSNAAPFARLNSIFVSFSKQGEVSLIFVFRFSFFVFRFSLFVFRFSFFIFHFCHFAMSEIRYDAISNPILLLTNRENMLF